MIIDITADLSEVKLMPGSVLEEIAQNVRSVLTTIKGTIPMDREFGIDGQITDLPIQVAQAKMTSEIVEAISRYEPRAQLVSVSYAGDGQDGVLIPTVKVRVKDES